MGTFKCYYCALTFGVFGELIKHLVDAHPTMCLKYRQMELDAASGKKGYRTKEFKQLIPEDGEIFVTSDEKIGIYRGKDNTKKTKMNTPVKCAEGFLSVENESPLKHQGADIDTLLQEMEMNILPEADNSEEFNVFIKCIPAVLENLKESGHLNTFKKFCELISQNKFPMTNIGFLLFLDIVDWFSTNNTSEMRYLRHETRQFWEVGYRLFKGKFLRFMSGPRGTGNIVKRMEESGQCSSEESRINFAVPSMKCLLKEKLDPILPGVIENSIEILSECLGSEFIKIGVDGKKIARGKGNVAGDIDCWGFEPSPTLTEKADRYKHEQSEVDKVKCKIESFVEKDHHFIPEMSIPTLITMLQRIILLISNRIKDLRRVVVRLQLGIQKFMKLGDQSDKHWSKSRYAPVISSFKVNNYDAEQAIESSLRIINELCYYCSVLNGCERCYSKNGVVDVIKHEKYHQLKSCIPCEEPVTVKQKSDTWFKLRKKACVTGSSCNKALGLGKLKDLQAHYDKVKLGKENSQFSDIQLKNMSYGTEHEIDGIATVVARIIPSMFPSTEYFEEGCIPLSHESNPFFMIVSPDGSLREPNHKRPTMMYENKCKIDNIYSTPVYYEIPRYYIPQLLCEMSCCSCEELLFTCWSKKSTVAFKVFFDQELWKVIWNELILIYSGENCKRPNKFPEGKITLEKMIDTFLRENIQFIGEFPSCSAAHTPPDVIYDGGGTHTSVEVGQSESREIQCCVILKSLHEYSRILCDIYKLCRTSASEILIFMANDLHRTYHEEMNNAHPIAYALKGASMTNEVFGNMLEHVIKKCEEKGLKVIATSSDGQWHKYEVRGKANRPLTLYQLQRDIWKKHISHTKPDILKYIRNLCRVSSLDNVEISKDTSGRYVLSHAIDKPLKVFKNCCLKWEADKSTVTTNNGIDDFENEAANATNVIIPTIETFAPDIVIDDNIFKDLDRNIEFHNTENIDIATTNYLSMLFEGDMNTSSSSFSSSIPESNHVDQSNRSLSNQAESFPTMTSKTDTEYQASIGDSSTVMAAAYSMLYETSDIDHISSNETEDNLTYEFAVEDYGLEPQVNYYTDIQSNSAEDPRNDNYQSKVHGIEGIHITSTCVEDQDTSSENPSGVTDASNTEYKSAQHLSRSNIMNSDDVSNDVNLVKKCQIMLTRLQSNDSARREEWSKLSVMDFTKIVVEKSKCCAQLQKTDMLMCLRELDSQADTKITYFKSWTKTRLFNTLLLALTSEGNALREQTNYFQPVRQRRRKTPEKLTKILSKWLNKVPKETLAVIIAQNSFQDSYTKWLSESVKPNADVLEASQFRSWFSLPDSDGDEAVRFHFSDCCHVLTCLRVKLCTTGICGLQKCAWDKAAESGSTNLNIAIVKECIDKQSVPFARRMFDHDVELFMRQNSYDKEADFVHLIRQWFEAEDSPGISAMERCVRRLKLRDYLLEGINFALFPPVTRYMKGIPIVTFESLLVHLERKLQIFQYLPGRKYNVRALGTQEVEQFFSTMRDMDPSGQGTPKPDDIPDIVATAAYLDNIRMKPDRSFYMKTSRAPVYPVVVYDKPCGGSDENELILEIEDHFFDLQARLRRKQKRKSGLVSSPSQAAHRQRGVRQYHTCDESKILPHLRKGLTDI